MSQSQKRGKATKKAQPPKVFSKKSILIICAAVLVVVGALLFVFLRAPSFENVEENAMEIAGVISSGENYFCLDTFPASYAHMDESVVALLAPMTQKNVQEAIQYVNKELGFGKELYTQMLETTPQMGSQSVENNKYRVSWTYHPDNGLEVKYEKK